jgi:hypothetical protein
VPIENSRFSSHIHVAGTASDDESGLASVELELRKGDKRGYELPAFIQGLYLDGHFLGATTSEAGLKLIANVFYLPFASLFGPDWDAFSSFMKKYSLYVEEEAWFVTSDVPGASTILFRTTCGVKLGLF